MPVQNRQYRLAARPIGLPQRTDWTFTEAPVGEPVDGEFLVRNLYVSLDPAMRGWMNDAKSYMPPVALGDVMRAGAVGRVIASRHPRFPVGDHVVGTFGVQEYAISNGKGVHRVDPALAPLPTYLGALGMPGMTAYFGLLDVGQPQPGNTVVVSGAAGAVGALVGQIAKIKACRVVGIAGGRAKCDDLVQRLGFDAAIDYKADNVRAKLAEHCPAGIDVYFDNVGGDILDAALARLALHARVVICGAISQYNSTTGIRGPSNYLSLLVNRASMTGMLVFDYADRYGEGVRDMAAWLAAGKITAREDIVTGLDNFPEALLMLFKGENNGKLVLEVASPE
jgi:NADPH-dependent curcumin reductase CurA